MSNSSSIFTLVIDYPYKCGENENSKLNYYHYIINYDHSSVEERINTQCLQQNTNKFGHKALTRVTVRSQQKTSFSPSSTRCQARGKKLEFPIEEMWRTLQHSSSGPDNRLLCGCERPK